MDVFNQSGSQLELVGHASFAVTAFESAGFALASCYRYPLTIHTTTPLSCRTLQGCAARFSIKQGSQTRDLPGYIASITQRHVFTAHYLYVLEFVCPLQRMTHCLSSRVFVSTTIANVLHFFLQQIGMREHHDYFFDFADQPLPFIRQVAQSDFEFFMALLRRAALQFCFAKVDEVTALVLFPTACESKYLTAIIPLTATNQIDCWSLEKSHRIVLSTTTLLFPGNKVRFRDQLYRIASVSERGAQLKDASVHSEQQRYSAQIELQPLSICDQQRFNPLANLNIELAQIEGSGEFPDVDKHGEYHLRFYYSDLMRTIHHNSAPISLCQTIAGDSFGSHFALQHDVAVVIGYLNDDPTQPFIIGCLYRRDQPDVVTDHNAQQNIFRSWRGNELLLDDTPDQQQISLSLFDRSTLLSLDSTQNNERIYCASPITQFYAGKKIIASSNQTLTMQVDQQSVVDVSGNFSTKSRYGFIRYETGKDHQHTAQHSIEFRARSASLFVSSEHTLNLQAREMLRLSSTRDDLQINAGDTSLHGQQINLRSAQGDIVFRQGGSILTLTRSGEIRLSASKIIIRSQNFLGATTIFSIQARQRSSRTAFVEELFFRLPTLAHMGVKKFDLSHSSLKSKQTHQHQPQLSVTLHFNYWINGNTVALSHQRFDWIADSHHTITAQSDPLGSRELAISEAGEFQIDLPAAEIISVDDRPQTPWFRSLALVKHDRQTLHIQTLWPPIIVNFRNQTSFRDLLSTRDLFYFKQNGNNVTLFIHGYNVPEGQFSKHIDNIEIDNQSLLNFHYTQFDATTFRNQQTLRSQLRDCEYELDDSVINQLNGQGDHAWFVAMEDNLNIATQKFDRSNYRKFTRLLHISWPGNPDNLFDYVAAQNNSVNIGRRLSILLQQLQRAGIRINIVAHSLGNAVVVHALQQLAMSGLHHAIDTVVMWQAAVPATIFTRDVNVDHSFHHVWNVTQWTQAAEKFVVLYSQNDNILGPLLRHPQQSLIDHDKTYDEFYLSRFVEMMGLQSIYALATDIGVPVTDLLSSSIRHSYYRDWIKEHPNDCLGHPFKNNLYEQFFSLLQRGVAQLIISNSLLLVAAFAPRDYFSVIEFSHIYAEHFTENLINHFLFEGHLQKIIHQKSHVFLSQTLESIRDSLASHHSTSHIISSFADVFGKLKIFLLSHQQFSQTVMRKITRAEHEFHQYLVIALEQSAAQQTPTPVVALQTFIELATLSAVLVTSGYQCRPALGYHGADISDEYTQHLIVTGKIIQVDQKDLLHSHSDMKHPREELMRTIYQGVVLKHLSMFGAY